MADPPNITTPESAKKIFKSNCVELKEVLELFSTNEKDLELYRGSYSVVPYGNELLYNLSNNSDFILFPGLPLFGKKLKPLTMRALMGTQEFGKFFDIKEESKIPANQHLNIRVCRPEWHLLSKKIISLNNYKRDFLLNREIPTERCELDPMIVYVYAWIIFYKLRGEELFGKGQIDCSDRTTTTAGPSEFSLKITDKKIIILPWQPKGRSFPPSDFPNMVPSILHHTR